MMNTSEHPQHIIQSHSDLLKYHKRPTIASTIQIRESFYFDQSVPWLNWDVLTTSGCRLIIQSFCMAYLKVGQKLGIFKDEIFKSKIQSFSCLRTERTEKFMTTAQQEGTQMEFYQSKHPSLVDAWYLSNFLMYLSKSKEMHLSICQTLPQDNCSQQEGN